jgi:hypothetical protein
MKEPSKEHDCFLREREEISVGDILSARHCSADIIRRRPVVPITDNYDRLFYEPDAITRSARYSHYIDENDCGGRRNHAARPCLSLHRDREVRGLRRPLGGLHREIGGNCDGVYRGGAPGEIRTRDPPDSQTESLGTQTKEQGRGPAQNETNPIRPNLLEMLDRDFGDLKRLLGRSSHDLDRVAARASLPCAFREYGGYWISRHFATTISNCGNPNILTGIK